MSKISIQKIGITKLNVDAIVNAANSGLKAGGGVCGAIFKDAGYSELQAACDKIGHCDTGSAVITPGFKLKAKYIIHAVGPVWNGGNDKEPQLLYSCYRESLYLAVKHGCKSIAFPLISAGIYGYPKDKAWKKAIQSCRDFMSINPSADIDIVFAVIDDEMLKLGEDTLKAIMPEPVKTITFEHPKPQPKLTPAKKSDWKTEEMPAKHDTFTLHRHISGAEMASLRMGNIPQEMEDKWFWYCDGNTLYAHRSWTGFCVYIIDLVPDGDCHSVIVNRDPSQYKCTSIAEDEKTLNMLLNYWTKPAYDYYTEWLNETVINIQKQSEASKFDTLKINGKTVPAVYFHLPEEPYGFLSNWYMSDFELDGLKFTSNEQYIMYRKCNILGDIDSAKLIMSTDSPAKQQQIAGVATGFNGTVWGGLRQVVAMRGLYAKFSQNPQLKQQLLDTDDAYLVECANKDTNWACGWHLYDDERHDVSKWRGQNILGFALMEVRAQLKNEM